MKKKPKKRVKRTVTFKVTLGDAGVHNLNELCGMIRQALKDHWPSKGPFTVAPYSVIEETLYGDAEEHQ